MIALTIKTANTNEQVCDYATFLAHTNSNPNRFTKEMNVPPVTGVYLTHRYTRFLAKHSIIQGFHTSKAYFPSM